MVPWAGTAGRLLCKVRGQTSKSDDTKIAARGRGPRAGCLAGGDRPRGAATKGRARPHLVSRESPIRGAARHHMSSVVV